MVTEDDTDSESESGKTIVVASHSCGEIPGGGGHGSLV